jgi:ferredoxin
MMEATVKALLEWGVPERDVRFEAFGPASVKTVKKADPAEDAASPGVTVEFARTGKSLVWKKSAGTLLELAEANGIRLNSGCRAGNCGTCVTAVKRGKVSYLTKPASAPAQGSALVCIAHPDGDIALDA